jgi:hypothetical protein
MTNGKAYGQGPLEGKSDALSRQGGDRSIPHLRSLIRTRRIG